MKTSYVQPKLFALIFIFLLFFFAPLKASSGTATDEMKSTIDGVFRIVTNNAYKQDHKTRRQKIRSLIDQRFSYEQMGMRSMGKNWGSISEEEQKEFINLFSKLLENSYATKIESAKEAHVNYKGEKIKGKYALVKTEIVRNTGPIPVDYKLINLTSKWKVYDVVIEGVSLVKNYRSQFSRIIHQGSYQALKKKIVTRISKIEANKNISGDL
tara:strand:- start:2854 stop:3489 length:636 start_codon:yes stop_codon:yes gene_type:complete